MNILETDEKKFLEDSLIDYLVTLSINMRDSR